MYRSNGTDESIIMIISVNTKQFHFAKTGGCHFGHPVNFLVVPNCEVCSNIFLR